MIVESPNKTKKIQSALGAGWEVVASVGHIRDLPAKEMAVDLLTFEPTYQLTERGAQVVSRLKTLVSRADEVFLATDPDREGEAISWHLLQVLRPRRYHRVTFDAITPAVIKKALTTPRKINENLVLAYKARRVLDRLVGYQVSPVLSDQTTVRGLSAGRVQSPAVRLVVEREREIQAFRETKHFGAEVSFDQGSWRATWETAPHLAADEKYILDEGLATRAAACRRFRVLSSETKTVPPGTASTLYHVHAVAGRECVTRLQARPYLSARTEAIRARANHLPPHRQPEFQRRGLERDPRFRAKA
jgi:DNA topoisomerase-1